MSAEQEVFVSTDILGAIARIGPEQVVKASRLVRQGRVYDLGCEISMNMPTGGPRYFIPYSLIQYRTPEDIAREPGYEGYSFSSDAVIGAIHTSTHIDGLAHIQHCLGSHGGLKSADLRTDFGWTTYGAETIPPIIGRGVLLDAAGLHGVERLEDGYEVTADDLRRCLERANLTVERGDVVLVRTGKIQQYGRDNRAFQAGEPGPGVGAARWLHEQGMAALGGDSPGVEPLPFKDSSNTVHRAMVVEAGVHLIENLNLEELARDRVAEFLFVCLPLKIVGATGSWIRPIAVV
jgi:kynurenine formamidase